MSDRERVPEFNCANPACDPWCGRPEAECCFPDCALVRGDHDAGHDPRDHFGIVARMQSVRDSFAGWDSGDPYNNVGFRI